MWSLAAGRPTAESNLNFATKMQEVNSEWGLRDIQDIIVMATTGDTSAEGAGGSPDPSMYFEPILLVDMPANNKMLVLRKADKPASTAYL